MAGDRAFLMAARFRVRMAEMGLRRAFEVFVPTAMTAGSHGLTVANRAPCTIDHNLPQIAARPGPWRAYAASGFHATMSRFEERRSDFIDRRKALSDRSKPREDLQKARTTLARFPQVAYAPPAGGVMVTARPLPRVEAVCSMISRNGLTRSMGMGNMTVELFSRAISLKVWR